MDTQKIAKILFYMSLDMDYADSLEYKDEEVKCITEELEILNKMNVSVRCKCWK